MAFITRYRDGDLRLWASETASRVGVFIFALLFLPDLLVEHFHSIEPTPREVAGGPVAMAHSNAVDVGVQKIVLAIAYENAIILAGIGFVAIALVHNSFLLVRSVSVGEES